MFDSQSNSQSFKKYDLFIETCFQNSSFNNYSINKSKENNYIILSYIIFYHIHIVYNMLTIYVVIRKIMAYLLFITQ